MVRDRAGWPRDRHDRTRRVPRRDRRDRRRSADGNRSGAPGLAGRGDLTAPVQRRPRDRAGPSGDRQGRDGTAAREDRPGGLVRMSVVEDLEALPVFAAATHEQSDQLAKFAEEIDVPAGAELTHEGTYEGTVFVVVKGSVAIERHGHAVNLIRAGDFF